MILAAAQTVPNDGNIDANLDDHYRLIDVAAEHGADLLIFPEMSLTGYQRSNARSLAFTSDDVRLKTLQERAVNSRMTVIAGAPLLMRSGLHIGAFLLSPDNTVSLYTKRFLHEGEGQFFTPNNDHNPLITVGADCCALAICADIANPLHPAQASALGATIYLASLFYTPNGIREGHEGLASYAREYRFPVLMANYGGVSWGLESGGQSAFWDETGQIQSSLEASGAGLVLARKRDQSWDCSVVRPE